MVPRHARCLAAPALLLLASAAAVETKAGWHRMRLPDGRQGWLADSVTSTTRP
jgi:SH3-like domain-containing protein